MVLRISDFLWLGCRAARWIALKRSVPLALLWSSRPSGAFRRRVRGGSAQGWQQGIGLRETLENPHILWEIIQNQGFPVDFLVNESIESIWICRWNEDIPLSNNQNVKTMTMFTVQGITY